MDEKKVEAMKRYPGLCLPDNPERAIQLLEPDSKDVRAAKDALNEVHVMKVHIFHNQFQQQSPASSAAD